MASLERATWPAVFIPSLIGHAKQAAESLPICDINDYKKVKSKILKMLNQTPEAYCQMLCEIKFGPDYHPCAIAQQIRAVGRTWLCPESMTKGIMETVFIEHFMAILPFNPKGWLLGQHPATLEEAAMMMEAYASSDAGLNLISSHLRLRNEEWCGPHNPMASGTSAAVGCNEQMKNRNVPENVHDEPTRGKSPVLMMQKPMTKSPSSKYFICTKAGHFECPHMRCFWLKALGCTKVT